MININELRKGNLVLLSVNYKDNIHRVDEIYTNEVKVTSIEDGGCFPRMIMGSCNPIALIPEWLERCGLVEKGSSMPGVLKVTGEGNFTIEADEEGKLKYYLPFQKKIEIKYVHQLQNIYLDLTGEELNVKL